MTRRVALISSSYDPYPGGVEEHTRHVARELAARGHTVEVWTVDRGEHLGTRVVDGVTVHYLPAPLPSATPRGVASFVLAVKPAWRAWRRVQRRLRPDILHVQCFGPNGAYAWALSRVARIPLVVSSHGETFADEHDVFAHSRILSSTLTRAMLDAEAVTGCSRLVLDDLHRRFGLRRHGLVVPNGVDPDEAETLGINVQATAGKHPLTVFAVGRMVRVKGFDLLVRAFAAAHLPAGTRLIIGGDGPERQPLQKLAEDLGISDAISFPGRLDRRQVVRGMAEADVVVVPSRTESFGIVVLEAWRSGTALVATCHGGPGELVHDRVDGLLVDPADLPTFARTMTDLLADEDAREQLAQAGRQSVESYTWGRVADLYTDIYDSVGCLAGRRTVPDR